MEDKTVGDPDVHPVDRPVLPAMMLLTLVAGGGLACFGSAPGPMGDVLRPIGTLLLVGFVVLFLVYCLAWLLREHENWRLRQAALRAQEAERARRKESIVGDEARTQRAEDPDRQES